MKRGLILGTLLALTGAGLALATNVADAPAWLELIVFCFWIAPYALLDKILSLCSVDIFAAKEWVLMIFFTVYWIAAGLVMSILWGKGSGLFRRGISAAFILILIAIHVQTGLMFERFTKKEFGPSFAARFGELYLEWKPVVEKFLSDRNYSASRKKD